MIAAWADILSDVDFTDALDALRFARRDSSIGYLEPKHILAKLPQVRSVIAADVRSAKARHLIEREWVWDARLPQPVYEALETARRRDNAEAAAFGDWEAETVEASYSRRELGA